MGLACRFACLHWGTPEALRWLKASTSCSAAYLAGYLACCRHPLHGPQGPLQGLLTDIMASAERSPQLLAAAAVRLCGLWVQHPARALSYVDVWERLLLSGGSSAAPQHAVRSPTIPQGPLHALAGQSKSSAWKRMTQWDTPGKENGAEQGAHLAEDFHTDQDVQEARLSADMAARVATVSAVSQLAQMAADPSQLHRSASAASDAQHAGVVLAFRPPQRTCQKISGQLMTACPSETSACD